MEDKLGKYVDDFLEKRTHIISNIDRIAQMIKQQRLVINENSLASQKELVFKNVTASVSLLSEVNYSLLHFLETCINPSTSELFNDCTVNSQLVNGSLEEDSISIQSSKSDSLIPMEKNSAVHKLNELTRLEEEKRDKIDHSTVVSNLKFVPASSDTVKKQKKHVKEQLKSCNDAAMVKMERNSLVVFSHIISPKEFYLQVVDKDSTRQLDYITHRLSSQWERSSSEYKLKKDAALGLGRYCCGYVLKDDIKGWYRLEVLDWKLNCQKNDIKCQAIDYGFTCILPFVYLRPMANELKNIPNLARKCHFPLLYPPGSTPEKIETVWPDLIIQSMQNIAFPNGLEDKETFGIFELTFCIPDGDSLAVDMAQYGNSEPLGHLLVEFGLAVEILDQANSEVSELDEFLKDVNDLETPNNLNEMIWGHDPKDESRICKFTKPDGTCYKKNCRLEHVVLKDGYTTDMVLVNAVTQEIVPPQKGEQLEILVTGYIDSCTYMVQIIKNPKRMERFNARLDSEFCMLIDLMNKPKSVESFKSFHLSPPSVGKLILAYSSILNIWVRATVLESLQQDDSIILEVYAVDFGIKFNVPIKDVKEMKSDFVNVPYQAIKVYLTKYQHKPCDEYKAKEFFQKNIACRNFIAHFQSHQSPYSVLIKTKKSRDIGPMLIQKGFAEDRLQDICIESDTLYLE